MRLALFQPDIAGNTGALIRLAACLGVPLEVIEPAGFLFTRRELARAALDYAPLAEIGRHADWEAFLETAPARIVLLTTGATTSHLDFAFAPGDVLLLGRESAGVPPAVHRRAEARVRVPMVVGARALNVVTAAAIVLGEALRQTGGYPAVESAGDAGEGE